MWKIVEYFMERKNTQVQESRIVREDGRITISEEVPIENNSVIFTRVYRDNTLQSVELYSWHLKRGKSVGFTPSTERSFDAYKKTVLEQLGCL